MKTNKLSFFLIIVSFICSYLQIFSEGKPYYYITSFNLILLVLYFLLRKRYLIFHGYKITANPHAAILIVVLIGLWRDFYYKHPTDKSNALILMILISLLVCGNAVDIKELEDSSML